MSGSGARTSRSAPGRLKERDTVDDIHPALPTLRNRVQGLGFRGSGV